MAFHLLNMRDISRMQWQNVSRSPYFSKTREASNYVQGPLVARSREIVWNCQTRSGAADGFVKFQSDMETRKLGTMSISRHLGITIYNRKSLLSLIKQGPGWVLSSTFISITPDPIFGGHHACLHRYVDQYSWSLDTLPTITHELWSDA